MSRKSHTKSNYTLSAVKITTNLKEMLFCAGYKIMTKTTSDLANFIIDLEDEECPNFGLHVAAYQGDILQLKDLLSKPEYKENIDARIRPFLATPLRLAATG